MVYSEIIKYINRGYSLTKISKTLKISKQKLNYYIRILKKNNVVSKVGLGVYEIDESKIKDFLRSKDKRTTSKYNNQKRNTVRGHGWQFKVVVDVDSLLLKNALDFNKIKYRDTNHVTWTGFKFKIKGWTVEKTPKGFVVWFSKNRSVYSQDAKETFKEAIYLLKIEVLQKLESILDKSLKKQLKKNIKAYEFSVSNEHYALIKNEYAKLMRMNKEKLFVYNEDNKLWLIADYSFSIDELEAVLVGKAQQHANYVKKFFNDAEQTGKTIKDVSSEVGDVSSDLGETQKIVREISLQMKGFSTGLNQTQRLIQDVTKNQEYYAENMVSHVKAIQDLGKGINELRSLLSTETKAEDILSKIDNKNDIFKYKQDIEKLTKEEKNYFEREFFNKFK